MKLQNSVVAITGAANGIGYALAKRFKAEGARGIAVADIDAVKIAAVAKEIGALGFACDVSREQDIQRVVRETETAFGPIDLFLLQCRNRPGRSRSQQRSFRAGCRFRAILEHSRHGACLCSPGVVAANDRARFRILSQYGLGRWTLEPDRLRDLLGETSMCDRVCRMFGAITHRDHGIKVSVLCPQAVRTAMIGKEPEKGSAAVDGIISPEELAESVVAGLAAERFLILPHAVVTDYMQRKTADYDRWLGGMSKLRRRLQQ